MIAIVLSVAKNKGQRSAIRQSIQFYNRDLIAATGNNHSVKPLFLIGMSGGGLPQMRGHLDREIQDHQDILQLSREEDYEKIVYKILGAFIWVQWYKNLDFLCVHAI